MKLIKMKLINNRVRKLFLLAFSAITLATVTTPANASF